jgi:hypothetical protein
LKPTCSWSDAERQIARHLGLAPRNISRAKSICEQLTFIFLANHLLEELRFHADYGGNHEADIRPVVVVKGRVPVCGRVPKADLVTRHLSSFRALNFYENEGAFVLVPPEGCGTD